MILWLTLAALAAAPSAVADDKARASELMARAGVLRADGRRKEASAELQRAYEIYPDRDFLYMRGAIERELGNCGIAVELFAAFIAENPERRDIAAAQAQIDECEARIPDRPRPAAPVAPPARTTPPVEVPPPPSSPPRVRPPRLSTTPPKDPRVDTVPGRRPDVIVDERPRVDRLGAALLGSGVVLAVVGAGLVGGAAARAKGAEQSGTAGGYRETIADARRLNGAGVGVLVGATGLVVGGLVRWAVTARARKR